MAVMERWNMTSGALARGLGVAVLVLALLAAAGCEEDDSSNSSSPEIATVYVANYGEGSVSGYILNLDDGELEEMDGSPFAARDGTRALAVHPSGALLFTANEVHQSISVMEVNTNSGALTRLTSHATGTTTLLDLAATPDGAYLYSIPAPSGFGTAGWSVDADSGALTALPSSPYQAGYDNRAIVVEPEGEYALMSCYNCDVVEVQAINANNGALTFSAGPFGEGTPTGLAIHPTERVECHFASNGSSEPIVFCRNIANDGTLSTGGSVVVGANPVSIAMHPTEALAYIVTDAGIEAVSFNANAVPSLVGAGFPVDGGANPYGVTVDPSGGYLLVTDINADLLRLFAIDLATGELDLLGTEATGVTPMGVLSAILP